MEALHYLLMKAHSQLNRRLLGEAAALGLSPGQPKVLECLMRWGESNQKAIAESCEIEAATVGSILTRMERDGLVCRRQREGDRRALYVSLTPRGEAAGRQVEALFRRADAQAASGLTPEEGEQLCRLLEKVCAAVAENSEGLV